MYCTRPVSRMLLLERFGGGSSLTTPVMSSLFWFWFWFWFWEREYRRRPTPIRQNSHRLIATGNVVGRCDVYCPVSGDTHVLHIMRFKKPGRCEVLREVRKADPSRFGGSGSSRSTSF